MYTELTSNLGLFIPFAITSVIMLGFSLLIIYKDYKNLSVKMWMLLGITTVAFLGVIVGRIASGTFHWYYLLYIPIYVSLEFINNMFNKNHFIGQADIDIFNGAVALTVPTIINIMTSDYPEFGDAIKGMMIGGILMDLLSWLLIGFLVAILLAVLRWAIYKIIHRKESDKKISIEDIKVDAAVKIATTSTDDLMKKVDDIKENVKSGKKKHDPSKLRGAKIPVCVSFIPLLFSAMYMSMYFNA